jgi:hypothetical protein
MKKLLVSLLLFTIILICGCVQQNTTTNNENKITVTTTTEFTSIAEINNNPDSFENKPVKVNELFNSVLVHGLKDKDCAVIGFADYKLVDSQGLQLFIYAPERDLSQHYGQTVTVEGVIKISYEDKINYNPTSVTCIESGYYLEFSTIS